MNETRRGGGPHVRRVMEREQVTWHPNRKGQSDAQQVDTRAGRAALVLLGPSGCGGATRTVTVGTTQHTATTTAQPAQNSATTAHSDRWHSCASPTSPSAGPHNRRKRTKQNNPGIEQKVATCLHANPALYTTHSPTRVKSPSIHSSEREQIQNTVIYKQSAAAVKERFALWEAPEAPNCLTKGVSETVQDAFEHPESGKEPPEGT